MALHLLHITLTLHRGGGEGAEKEEGRGWRKKHAQHTYGGRGSNPGPNCLLGESPQLHATVIV